MTTPTGTSRSPTFLRMIGGALLTIIGLPPIRDETQTTPSDGPVKPVSSVAMKASRHDIGWGWWRRPGERLTGAHITGTTWNSSGTGARSSRQGRRRIGPPKAREVTRVGPRTGGGMFKWKHRAAWARRRFIQPVNGTARVGRHAAVQGRHAHRGTNRRRQGNVANRPPTVRPTPRPVGQGRGRR